MKGRTVVIDEIAGRQAAALLVDGRLDDLLIDPADDVPRPGAILRGRAQRPLKGQGGIFVDLPGGSTGFLRQSRGIAPGQALMCQVLGFASENKAMPLTTRLTLRGRFVVLTPDRPGRNLSRKLQDDDLSEVTLAAISAAPLPEECGLVIRSAAATAQEGEVADEIARLTAMLDAVFDEAGTEPAALLAGPDAAERAWHDWSADTIDAAAGAFERHEIAARIAAMQQPEVPLAQGASLIIEPTRALIAIDVNTGSDGSLAAGLKANIAAARALPAQLRCRGLGGQIVIDFAPAPRKDRRQIEAALRSAFRTDPVETVLAGWTPLGHFELQRKRDRLPLAESLP